MRVLAIAALVLAVVAPLAAARPAQPDRGFGPRGEVHPLPGTETSGHAVAVLPSGRIVGVGGARRGFAESFAVTRLSPRGKRERLAFVSFGLHYAVATALAIGPGGRILVAGAARDDRGRERIAVAALRPSLQPEPGFGTNGPALGSVAAYSVGVVAVETDRAGRIVVAGTLRQRVDSGERTILSRFLPNGSIDTSFANGGSLMVQGGLVADVAVRRDGGILLAALPKPNGVRRPSFLMLRYTAGGRLVSRDARRVGRGSSYAGPAEILLRGDGSALVAGTVSDAKHRLRPALLRYGRDGRLDDVRRLGRAQGSSETVGLERRSDGRLVLGVRPGAWGTWEFRGLTAAGRPDGRFGVHVARKVGEYDEARLNDFAVHGRRIVGIATDENDDRIDYFSYALLAAFRG